MKVTKRTDRTVTPAFRLMLCGCFLGLLCLLMLPVSAAPQEYFRITVVDADTGRGVPLVELKTTNQVSFWTDSNGIVAINEPGLMGKKVYFLVKSHGYELPADGFGNRGMAFQVTPGGQEKIQIKRLNIAERLYRITGQGIYRDSALLGLLTPLKESQISGLVMGQDTVFATPYKGKIFWLWGDTNRPSYPLGNFFTSSATSLPPGNGGLDPGVGVDLTYWVDEEGFSKKMMPMESNMPVWLSALFTVKNAQGQEQLFAKYAQVKSDSAVNEYGLARFNDEKALFEKVIASDGSLFPDGHPFRAIVNGQEYLYFQTTGSSDVFPLVRVRASAEQVVDLSRYEGFTPLAVGSRYDKENTRLERGADGKLIYGWKAGTPPLNFDQRRELVSLGKMKAEESPIQLRSLESDALIKSHGGSVFWNPYRGRWVMVASQAGGTSYLGEMWFSEADTPVGPWVYAKKILTHDKYTFYNPTQHPFFDQENGRLIYFEGTYTNTYSGTEDKTPRYDYNQIMYRLTLDDPRLTLPVPVYQLRGENGATSYGMREVVASNNRWGAVQEIPFYAVPPSRNREGLGLIPIYSAAAAGANSGATLQANAPAGAQPLFYALPATAVEGEKPASDVVPLYEYRNAATGERWYATSAEGLPATATRAEQAVCRVWRNPSSVLALDTQVQPLPQQTMGAAEGAPSKVTSGNPVFPGWYADPEVAVFDKKYWIYPTYSAGYFQQTFMDAFSSPDLVNWTKHPRIVDTDAVKWAKYAMWAPSIISKDGKYFLFFGANDIQKDDQVGGIGVAVANSPAGPFKDYLGKPLVDKFHNGAQPIDQFVFQDKDGQYYLIYGGWRHCNIAKLKNDFTGFVPFDDGTTFKEITPQGYTEGPIMFVRNGKYYFMWSEGAWTGPDYRVAYAIADSPLGPFQRIGTVLQQDPAIATGAGHHSVLNVPGTDDWYIVYHRRPVGDSEGNHRVTCIDRMFFDEKGFIQPVKMTNTGVAKQAIK